MAPVDYVTEKIGKELDKHLDLLDFMDLREMQYCLRLRGIQEETNEDIRGL